MVKKAMVAPSHRSAPEVRRLADDIDSARLSLTRIPERLTVGRLNGINAEATQVDCTSDNGVYLRKYPHIAIASVEWADLECESCGDALTDDKVSTTSRLVW